MARARPTKAALATWRTLLHVHVELTTQLDEELRAATGLPLEWYDVLLQLTEHGGRLRMHELADAVLLSRSNCTRLVDRLESEGLVRREPDPDDARGRFAIVTNAGRALQRRAGKIHLEGIERHFGAPLGDAAPAMLEALQRVLPPPAP